MSEKMTDSVSNLDYECICALSEALNAAERVVADRISNKMSTGRISAVARELRELIKVVSISVN